MAKLSFWFAGFIVIALEQSVVNSNPVAAAASTVCVTCVVPQPCVTCAGQWGEWGPWSACTFQYGVWGMSRERQCIGTNCQGARDEAIQCAPPTTTTTTTLPPPVWSAWGAWGACSASCGGGAQSRTRQCIKQCGQMCDCVGAAMEQRSCNPQACCVWRQWSAWSSCSVSCGNDGITVRTRRCSCAQGGCSGESTQQQACSAPACPQPMCDSSPTCTVCCTAVVVPTCTTCQTSCAQCQPSQPCYATCYPGGNVIPVIGSSVPVITTRSLPEIGGTTSGSGIPQIGSSTSAIPQIGGSTSSVPQIGASSTVPQIGATSSIPQIGSGTNSGSSVPVIGQGASYSDASQYMPSPSSYYNPYGNGYRKRSVGKKYQAKE